MKAIQRLFALFVTLMLPSFIFAQEAAPPKGLDEKINEWFAPIAEVWGSIIFYPIQFTDTVSVPFVVILLVLGA